MRQAFWACLFCGEEGGVGEWKIRPQYELIHPGY